MRKLAGRFLLLFALTLFAFCMVGGVTTALALTVTGPATFSAWTPADGSSVGVLRPPISVKAYDVKGLAGSPYYSMKVDGGLQTATFARTDANNITLSFTPKVDLANGTHTVYVSVKNNAGVYSTTTWSFTVSNAPKPSSPLPTPGSTVDTTSPTISVAVGGATSGLTSTVKVDGAIIPATFNSTTGVLSAPTSKLANDASHDVTVTVTNASGASATLSWSFSVQIYASMPTPAAACVSCHPGFPDAHPMDNCLGCHGIGSPVGEGWNVPDYGPHPASYIAQSSDSCVACHSGGFATVPPMHAFAPTTSYHDSTSVCSPCHVKSLTTEHFRYGKDCFTCHASSNPLVAAAIAAGRTDCEACHPGAATHTTVHQTTVPESCSGAYCHAGTALTEIHDDCNACHKSTDPRVVAAIAGGVKSCDACHDAHQDAHNIVLPQNCTGTGCHAGTSLLPIHLINGNTCAMCHATTDPAIRNAIETHQTACTACHSNTDHGPFHDTPISPSCAGAGCHTGSNLIAVHDTATCSTCHSSTDPKVAAAIALQVKDCIACHGSGNPHPNLDVAHVSSDATSMSCAAAGCHGTTNALALHAGRAEGACAVCHDNPTKGDLTAGKSTTACGGCHANSGVDYHTNMAVHTTPVADYETCGHCHHGWGSNPTQGPDVTRHPGGCVTCHNATTVLPESTRCANCHKVDGGDFHVNESSIHTPTDSASLACAVCHESTDVRAVHSTSACATCHITYNCSECHSVHGADSGPGLTLKTSCSSCHSTEGTNYHSDITTAHASSVTSGPISVLGTSYGTFQCSMCHASNDLRGLHSNNCTLCHPTLTKTLGAWNGSCTAAGCHATGTTKPMHAAIDTAHTRATGGASDACFASGCHSGGTSLASMHAARQGCATCHGSGKTPTANCSASGCHDLTNPHAALEPVHQSSDAADTIGAYHGDSVYMNCGDCHTLKLITLHNNNCTACHGAAAAANVKAAVTAGNTACTACHTSPHVGDVSAHDGIDYGECGPCHGNGCTQCHGADNYPPSTSSNVKASYVGTASITLSASDAFGVQATYYRLDGAAQAVYSSALLVPAPATGSANHTLEYWSIDPSANEETHHNASFTVAADTVAPVTTSDTKVAPYFRDATIKLTATDNATTFGVRATYYRFDSGTVQTGTTAVYPFAPSETHTIHFWSVDYAGNIEGEKSAQFSFGVTDLTAPTTTSDFNPATNALYSSSRSVNLSAIDNAAGSGVYATYYKIDSGAVTTGTAFTVSGDGPHSFSWSSVDVAGNRETTHTSNTFRIDSTPPVTNSTAQTGATYYGAQTFTLSPTDAGSGVSSTCWSVDSASGPWTSGTSIPVASPPSGTASHTIYWYSTDVAGNTETTKSAVVVLGQSYTAGSRISASGAPVYFTVPAGVTNLTVDLYGAQADPPGVGNYGGKGGYLKANLTVIPGQTLVIKVGKASTSNVGGWGGGSGGTGSYTGGGGSTSIASGSSVLAEAGGGGGAGIAYGVDGGNWSASATGGNANGGGGNYCGGGGGWTGGATGKYGGDGGTSRTLSGSYITYSVGANSGDGYMSMTWSGGVTYTLAYAAGTGGTISGTTPQTVSSGGSGTAVTAVPNTGYHFTSWSDGVATATRTDTNVQANKTVTASFAINTYTLTYTAGANGTISGTSPQTVNYNLSGSAVTAVANTGYHFTGWSDGVATATRTDSNVVANKTVTASFAINTYTLTYTAGANGTISGTTPQTVNYNLSGSAVTAVPNSGYVFSGWSDGVATATRTDANVVANKSVTANFAVNAYTLTYTAGANGTISGTSPQTVSGGGSGTAVTAVPNSGYVFSGWSDGISTATRTDTNVVANKSVTANFIVQSTGVALFSTGGTITTSGGTRTHSFSSGTTTLTAVASGLVTYTIRGAGGGGGGGAGDGGTAGDGVAGGNSWVKAVASNATYAALGGGGGQGGWDDGYSAFSGADGAAGASQALGTASLSGWTTLVGGGSAGGAGGANVYGGAGGAGGAGGQLVGSLAVTAGQQIVITVGTGGAGGSPDATVGLPGTDGTVTLSYAY